MIRAFIKTLHSHFSPPVKQTDSETPEESIAREVENEGLPSVNRRQGRNRLVTVLGFAFIAGLALILIVTVNSGSKGRISRNTEKQPSEQVSNKLPPLTLPPPQPVQSLPVTTPVPAVAQATVKTEKDSARTGAAWSDRKLEGGLMIEIKAANTANSEQAHADASARSDETPSSKTALGSKLDATVTVSRSAAMLRDRDFLITKGTSLDCVLETAMDSSLPGMTTCRLTRDVWSDNGRVLLLDRGSQLVGEYQGGIRQGQTRLFVLWTRAKTPNGVIISLDSPGADALGRSGHEGWADNHFWQRFGAAILMSLVKDGITVLAQNSGSGSNNTNIYGSGDSGGAKIVEKMLDSTINIPPTIIKNQGERIQVMVARDLDFSTVYGLRSE